MMLLGLNGPIDPRLKGAGLGSTFTDAQEIAAALAADPDGAGFERAAEILGRYAGAELTLVGNKAIALGADPDRIKMIVDALGGEGGEVINVVGTLPPALVKAAKVGLVAAALAGLGVGLASYAKKRAALAAL